MNVHHELTSRTVTTSGSCISMYFRLWFPFIVSLIFCRRIVSASATKRLSNQATTQHSTHILCGSYIDHDCYSIMMITIFSLTVTFHSKTKTPRQVGLNQLAEQMIDKTGCCKNVKNTWFLGETPKYQLDTNSSISHSILREVYLQWVGCSISSSRRSRLLLVSAVLKTVSEYILSESSYIAHKVLIQVWKHSINQYIMTCSEDQ